MVEQIDSFIPLQIYPPAGIYLLQVNNRNAKTRCEICSELIIKTPERRTPYSNVSIVDFEHVITGWTLTFVEQLSNTIKKVSRK